MNNHKGFVDSVAASGGIWGGFEAQEVKSLVFDSLKNAKRSIQISIFSLGEKNDEMEEFFNIIEEKVETRDIQFIVNNADGKLIGKFSKNKLNKLAKYENFDLCNFVSKQKRELLHAKIIVIDREFALVGSANMTKHGMFSNYEIMLKITGSAVATITNLLDRLVTAIKNGEEL